MKAKKDFDIPKHLDTLSSFDMAFEVQAFCIKAKRKPTKKNRELYEYIRSEACKIIRERHGNQGEERFFWLVSK